MAARTRVQCRVSNMYVCMYVCIYIYIEIQYISNIYMAARTRVQCRASNPCPTAPSTCVYAVCIRVYAVYACSIPCVYACIRSVRVQCRVSQGLDTCRSLHLCLCVCRSFYSVCAYLCMRRRARATRTFVHCRAPWCVGVQCRDACPTHRSIHRPAFDDVYL